MILTITRNGITERRTVQEWSAISGTPVPTIERRKERGASDERAVFDPIDPERSARMRALGRAGGTARAAALPRERRKEIAAQASRVLNGAPTLITYDGFTGTAREWESRCGIPAALLYARKSEGWSDADAVTVPPGARRG